MSAISPETQSLIDTWTGADWRTMGVLTEVSDERQRQDAKWGPVQRIPNGTGHGRINLAHEYSMLLDAARMQNDDLGGIDATFESVLREEFCEAMLEEDPVKLRDELIQVAAVAVKWIEHIDRRAGG